MNQLREYIASLEAKRNGLLRFMLALILFIGVFQVFSYRFAGVMASIDGTMPVPQPDTLLYCQAAQRIADGHPFSYSVNEPPSTGTTSVAYPFVLAVPYVCGAEGRHLLTAGFWLNAGFYLIFLLGWCFFIWHFVQDTKSRIFSVLFLALMGQPAFCSMAQSDVGLLMAVTAWFAAGLAMRRVWVWGPILVFLPWVRPEGMMCVMGLGVAMVIRLLVDRKSTSISEWVVLLLSIASTLGVFLLNFELTGSFQFSSIANKGHFKLMPFASAISATFADALAIFRNYFCGLGFGGFGNLLTIPLFGGCAFVGGLLVYRCSRDFALRVILPLFLAACLSMASVATSGWQGTNFDRYLAWAQPLVILFVVVGVLRMAFLVGGYMRLALPIFFVAFYLGMSVVTVGAFHSSCRDSDRLLQFSEAMSRILPTGSTIGGPGCNYAYQLGEHRVFHFTGLYSLAFQHQGRTDSAACIEQLKREANCRPDYLVLSNPDSYFGLDNEKLEKICRPILVGPAGWEMKKANWALFDAAIAAETSPTGKSLVARVDVGYVPDEQDSALEVVDRWNRTLGNPFIHIGKLNGIEIIDCGRVISGAASMNVPLLAGRDVVVVVRSCYKETAKFSDGISCERTQFQLDDHLGFDIEINGKHAAHQHVHVNKPDKSKEDDFVEFTLLIPGEKIPEGGCRVTIDGDHIASEYRFYQ